MILGCIADDLTGATDLALMLNRGGLRTLQSSGIPTQSPNLGAFDALVIALKSRTIPVDDAVTQSLEACSWLIHNHAKRIFFKYCSTFDSTDEGNIGPVAEALLKQLNSDFSIACPAFPTAGRTIYMSHLFVNGVPLAESPMRDHPLTPMKDSDLQRVLSKQTIRSVGSVRYTDVTLGVAGIKNALNRERQTGHSFAIVDALDNNHLTYIGEAVAEMPLITGGSGLALGLPKAYLDSGLVQHLTPPPQNMEAPAGRSIILAGSCSAATREQVAHYRTTGQPWYQIDPLKVASGSETAADLVAWVGQQHPDSVPLIFSSENPETVKTIQSQLGRQHSGEMIESLIAQVSDDLVTQGFRRFIVAGGETSGAVVQKLKIGILEIGPEIDPGVPWTKSQSVPEIVLALKSGNFGSFDFFSKAWTLLS
jgi:uncharacterized protein YgbK (DUF1537 family)